MKLKCKIHRVIYLLIVFAMMFPLGAVLASGDNSDSDFDREAGLKQHFEEEVRLREHVVKAKIIDIVYDDTNEVRPNLPIESDIRYQNLKVRLSNTKHKGEIFTIRNTIEMVMPYNIIYKKGESIIMYYTEYEDGTIEGLRLFGRSREVPIYLIVILFAVLVILIGRQKGLKSIATLIFTIFMIFCVMLPLVLRGFSPILVAVGIASITSVFTLMLVSGRNKKTATAIMGTIAGVVIAGCVAIFFGQWAQLTGLGNEDAQLLAYIPQHRNMDYQGLLFAGIIIGALGAVMDVAMSMASAMNEIETIHPKISNAELFKSGMNVGRDVMGSMSNTLILAYVGGSIQILLLFLAYQISPFVIMNMDQMASEIIRALAGSIGLVCAIPATAVVYIKNRTNKVRKIKKSKK
ncbi:MAG: YibE/F family protein [Tissierellales bacterium]|jgi:uncharacterized membrane protein|nr:YibE/F family protein [Tissierellales bacterium]